jgi:hypothetical protein
MLLSERDYLMSNDSLTTGTIAAMTPATATTILATFSTSISPGTAEFFSLATCESDCSVSTCSGVWSAAAPEDGGWKRCVNSGPRPRAKKMKHQLTWMHAGGAREIAALQPIEGKQRGGRIAGERAACRRGRQGWRPIPGDCRRAAGQDTPARRAVAQRSAQRVRRSV